MAKYVDAEKISSHIRENFSIDKTKNADICFAFIDFMNWLDEQSTADVVEVKHCEKCKHYKSKYEYEPICEHCSNYYRSNFEPKMECCYCNSVEESGSKKALVDNYLDIINRQKAEIERLNRALVTQEKQHELKMRLSKRK